jgi:meiotically up-regulated gene 157 (Mug157) protein
MPFGGRHFRSRVVALTLVAFTLYIILSRKNEPQTTGEDIQEFVQFPKNFQPQPVVEGEFEHNSKEISDEVSVAFLKKLDKKTGKCPNYVDYSQSRHGPYSSGKYQYPYMRPAPKCRTFVSSAVERVIQDLKSRLRDPDLARLVENCLPNTLDTTILWHRGRENKGVSNLQSFVVTGDIHAEWLRDAARQLAVYQPFIKHDQKLKDLMVGAINTQANYLLISPYCNAFHPPPQSNVKKGDTAMDDVYPRPDWRQVFECKYELDSLASFLTLTNDYYENSNGDLLFLSELWMRALEKVLIVMKRESFPSFDKKTGQALAFYYAFKRQTNIGTETLPLAGIGNPVNYDTGLVRSAFRPSDDATILQFFIPANAHMVTELKRLRANFLNEKMPSQFPAERYITAVDSFIESISSGIEKYGIVDHPKWGKVYAYEVDGYGGNVFMDDANIPSLLSLPDMGYLDVDDEIYQNTRKMILAKDGNPYYLKGTHFEGIGGPHIGIHNAWPMSLLVKMRTSNDDDEIMESLNQIMKTTANLGLMHESVHVNSPHGKQFTRSWFAWCNSEFGKTILHLAVHKPHLIFRDGVPYSIDEALQ